MGKADLLSRCADYDQGDKDNENVTFIKEEWLARGIIQTSRQNLWPMIQEAQSKMEIKDLPDGLVEKDGVWMKKKQVFVPLDIRSRVLQEFHDSPLAGHPGSSKTVELVRRDFWWPTLYTDVRAYVRGCDKCQRTKALCTPRKKSLHPHDVPEGLWQTITVDLIGELPESNGFNTICVLVDRFSKQIHAVPTTTHLTAEGMAKIYRGHVFRLHGLPQKIIHN